MNQKEVALLALSIGALAALAYVPGQSDAAEHDDWVHDHELPGGEADFYFHYTSLNRLHVDGDTRNNYQKVKSSVQRSMGNYNRLLDVGADLSTSARLQGDDYVVYARSLGAFGFSAEASLPRDPDSTSTATKYVRFNTWRHWGTDGGCNSLGSISWAYNLVWVSNHELGHVLGLLHRPDGTNSAMVRDCSASWSSVQTIDHETLKHLAGDWG